MIAGKKALSRQVFADLSEQYTTLILTRLASRPEIESQWQQLGRHESQESQDRSRIMIAPTKHLNLNRSLLGVGADILSLLDAPASVSSLWEQFKEIRGSAESNRIPFDWFILAIDMLYLLGVVEYRRGRLVRSQP